MSKRIVQVYHGTGKGKTSAAVGQCIRAASRGQSVIMIQFLKGKDAQEYAFLKKLEPDIKLFCFEKENESYLLLPEEKQNDEKKNIINGLNFAKKVIDTHECDVVVLDEILGLIDVGIITVEDIRRLIEAREDYVRLVLTGQSLPDELVPYVDVISRIELIKDDEET